MFCNISKIKLTNFRNHQSFSQEIDENIIAIYGKNGSGKTNILEAISLLSPGRGLRTAKLSDLSLFDGNAQQNWSIYFEGEGQDGSFEIGSALTTDVESTDKRIIKINGQKQRGANALREYISIYYLTPAQDQTFS